MKEQINKLALQAREHADSLLGKKLPDMVWQDEYHKKFAELIVRECMEVAIHKDDGMISTADIAGYMSSGRATAAKMIAKHFGVE